MRLLGKADDGEPAAEFRRGFDAVDQQAQEVGLPIRAAR